MANWNTNTKHSASSINNGNRYEIQDRVTLEQLNAITENSFYASEKVDTVISDAQDVVTQGRAEIENTTSQGKNELNAIVDDAEDLVDKANASINTVVGTANEALFTVQQVVASKGYYGSNPNILINGDFRVNQRGQEVYTTTGTNVYTVDRWKIWSFAGTFNSVTKEFSSTGTTGSCLLTQYIEEDLTNKQVTLTFSVDNEIYSVTGIASKTENNIEKDIYNKQIYFRCRYDTDKSVYKVEIGVHNGYTKVINYAKLELGSVATAYSPRPYAEELALCQRYYQRIRVNGVISFVSNVNTMYAGIPLIQTLRTRPTVTNKVQTSIREIGKGIKGNIDLEFDALYDNILQIQANVSTLGLTQYSGCVLVNGTLSLDAEF